MMNIPPHRFQTAAVRAASLLLVANWSSTSLAETPDSTDDGGTAVARAEDYAAKAYAAYRNKQHAEAVGLYRKAYDIAPSADMLYNIARIYDIGLLDRPLAITFYRRYVADPGAAAERIGKANARLVELKAAEAASSQPPPSVQPSAPAFEVGVEQVAAAPVDSGDSGYWSAWRVGAAVTGAAGVVAFGVGTGFGLSAVSDADTVESYCDGNDCTDQRGVDAARSAKDSANLATLGFAVGGGLLAAGAALFLLEPDSSPEPESARNVSWTPVASSSGAGLELSGRW